jgi:DNA mismatch repair protein MutS2
LSLESLTPRPESRSLDGASEALEFGAVIALLERRAGSAGGRARVARCPPAADAAGVREALAVTGEARELLRRAGRQPFHLLPEIKDAVGRARIRGSRLEPEELLDLARFVEVSVAIADALDAFPSPRLSALVSRVERDRDLALAVRRALLPSGDVSDDASEELRRIRSGLLSRRSALESVMESYLHDRESEPLLQEKLVTTRNDRYVLVVKANQRSQLPGVVHGGSGSGASVFVEPLAAVDLNNEIVELRDAETREVARILEELSRAVGGRAEELLAAAGALAELDAAQARALLAEDMGATAPEIVEDGVELLLRGARHPLLIPALAAEIGASRPDRSEPVPVSLTLGGDETALVISGPNTGGKTVALKTAGVLALMAQSGLHVPAEPGSRLPVFRHVFAHIGDEQSLADSLSTFSGHVAALVRMVRELELPALVLLDEVGSGTDPTEGGALAAAVIEHFRRAGAIVLATTHHGDVKAYAEATPGVGCASFGYDEETFEPTYVLRRGVPGRSLALEVAERFGLPAAILADARSRRDADRGRLEDLIARLERERASLARERDRLLEREGELARALAQAEVSARRAETERHEAVAAAARRVDERAEEVVREGREAIAAAVRRVESSRGAAARAARLAGEGLRRSVREARERAVSTSLAPHEPVGAAIAVGDRVRIRGLGLTGSVLTLASSTAEVAVRGKRVQVPASELEPTTAPRPRPPEPAVAARGGRDVPGEINVIGLSVDEALPQVDKLLDDAALADRAQIRVIHGHGKGRLRSAVGGLLRDHPHVAAFHAAASREGGSGVTVVELK